MEYKELDESLEVEIENSSQTFRIIWEQLLKNWYWFIVGLSIAWTLTYFQLRYAERFYSSESKILIKEDAGTSGSELSVLAGRSLGRMDVKPNITDQIHVMTSRRLISKVVINLQLEVRYFMEGRVKRQELFAEASPIVVKLLTTDPLPVNFDVKVKPNSQILIIQGEKTTPASFGKILKLGNNELMILPNKGTPKEETLVQVSIIPIEVATNIYKGKFKMLPMENSSVVSVGMVDNLPDRANLVIDELIKQYNEDAINDKKLVGEKTTQFIEDRLAKVRDDLRLKDNDVEVFKKQNHVIDLAAAGSTSMGEDAGNRTKYIEQSNQLNLINYMEDYLKKNKDDLIPINVGLSDGSVNAAASKYNELILTKMDMLKYSTPNSQIVRNLNEQISEVETNLHSSLNNYKKIVQITLNRVESEGAKIDSKITKFPTQENEFKNIARQQSIVEALYLFLLQKREENEITNSATPSAIKVVDFAYSNRSPISPDSKRAYITATAFGFLIPFGILYLIYLLNNKVKNRKDVEKAGVSIIGEVPISKTGGNLIGIEDRSLLAESFRILRTNIGYYLSAKKKESKSIFVTSTVSGEGKTFIACNLAITLAATGKSKVLLMGADIRNPKLLKYFDLQEHRKHKGITEYLSDFDLNIDDLIITDKERNLDIVHSGVLAPNPSELLMNSRFKELIEEAKGRYDYVVVDTAPVNLVTDTQLMADYADLFLYVIRIDFSDKRLLEIPRDLYRNKRLPNMTMVINGVGAGWGFGYGYGYGYGYGHGYGYGYGNGYYHDHPKGWKKYLPWNLLKRL